MLFVRIISIANLSAYCAVVAVAIDFTISGTLLTDVGSSYVSEGGSLLAKIHPGSYLAMISGILRCLDQPHGGVGIRRRLERNGFILIFIAGMTFCCLYALVCTGFGGLIALIDSFLPAGMLALALSDMRLELWRRLRYILQILLAINASLAVIEAITQWHLIPIVLSGGQAEAEFRAAALYDHPLTGAAATMIGLFLRPDLGRHPILGTSYLTLMGAALLSFGERTPLALALMAMLACYIGAMQRKILRRSLQWQDFALIVTVSAATLALAAVALISGLGSRVTDHLYWDASAQVRFAQFGILKSLTLSEIIFGCRRADLLALIEPMRLSDGVEVLENFWLVMFATLGAVCFPIFVVSLLSLLWSLWRVSRLEGRIMIVSLMLTASASNSLGRKSTLLAMLVACVASTLVQAKQGSARMRHAAAVPC